MKAVVAFAFAAALTAGGAERVGRRAIRLNQLGYEPSAPKQFVIRNPPTRSFEVMTIGPDVRWRTVGGGDLKPVEGRDGLWTGDFSDIRTPADYRIVCSKERVGSTACGHPPADSDDTVWSYDFVVKSNVCDTAERMVLDFFTWQRCGSKKGWAGVCHQDPVTLYGTDRRLDLRGGYHQGGDLRGWADGMSMALYGLLRWAERRDPAWDGGRIDEELRWGIDYFLKLIGPEGFAYDSQFVPLGWGPRDYYSSPAPFLAQCNIVMLLARVARRFAGTDAVRADKCLSTTRRMWKDLGENPAYDTYYRPPVEPLPPGTQGTNFWWQSYRSCGTGIAGLACAALELYRTTRESAFAADAKSYARRVLALQIKEGPLSGAYRLEPGKDDLSFLGCVYGYGIHGWRTAYEFAREFPDDPEWRESALAVCDLFVRAWNATGGEYLAMPTTRGFGAGDPVWSDRPFVTHLMRGTGASGLMLRSLLLNEAADSFGRDDYRLVAQRMFDYVLGANPRGHSYFTGIGWENDRVNIYGQFFPSTPSMPGGMSHVMDGEYDLPPAGLFLWVCTALKR